MSFSLGFSISLHSRWLAYCTFVGSCSVGLGKVPVLGRSSFRYQLDIDLIRSGQPLRVIDSGPGAISGPLQFGHHVHLPRTSHVPGAW